MKHYIYTPHGDDEIIGCYEIIRRYPNDVVIVAMNKQAFLECSERHSTVLLFTPCFRTIPSSRHYFPDPTYERHPEHRKAGGIGEEWARKGADVLFYTTNMNAPYIHEVNTPAEKRQMLDSLYPEKGDLWKYENQYFLFEGRVKWMFGD